jgi:hypothetical protein
MPFNPFVLKAKQKLLEGYVVGDRIKLFWQDRYGEQFTHEGTITSYDGEWLRVDGRESYWHLPITLLSTVQRVGKPNPFVRMAP